MTTPEVSPVEEVLGERRATMLAAIRTEAAACSEVAGAFGVLMPMHVSFMLEAIDDLCSRLAEARPVAGGRGEEDSDDLRVAARFLRGPSWPLDMAQQMQDRSERLDSLADRLSSSPPVGEPHTRFLDKLHDLGVGTSTDVVIARALERSGTVITDRLSSSPSAVEPWVTHDEEGRREFAELQAAWHAWRKAQPWGQSPIHYAAKITEEAGEVMGATIKVDDPGHRGTHPQHDETKQAKEMGQLLGTLMVLAEEKGVDLIGVARSALADTEARFPARVVPDPMEET